MAANHRALPVRDWDDLEYSARLRHAMRAVTTSVASARELTGIPGALVNACDARTPA